MRKLFLIAVFMCLFAASCTPEVLTNEDETEILIVDPSDDGTIDDGDYREEDQ